MTVHTESAKFSFQILNGHLWVTYGLKEIQVTDIEDMEEGKKMTVKGYPVDCYSRVQSTKFEFTTSTAITHIE